MNDVLAPNPFGNDVAATAPASALIAAEQSKAITEVMAALTFARTQPRDPRRSMDRILQNCMRPGLAEEAVYQYSRGGNDITGPSIRLAETLAKCWGNMEAGVKEISRRDGVSECLAYAWDLESNYRDVRTFSVRHWRDTKKGGYALSDERDIYELIANYGARRKRACILALIDGDVIEAAVRQCEVTLATKVEVNDELIAQMIERFQTFGVTKEMIEKRIQRHMSGLTPALAVSLKRIYNSLRDGMSAPAEWFEMGDDPAANVAQPAGGTRTAAVKSRMKAKKDAKPKAAAGTQDETKPQYTYADVADRLKNAKTRDDLDIAADLIKSVIGDEALRTELGELYSTLAADFENGDAS